jgi:ribonuclease HI
VLQNEEEGWWHIDFDGEVSKEGDGAGICVRSLEGDPKLLSYKLCFDYTNNVVEYEALVLVMKMLKDPKAKKVYIYRYFELIINQVKGIYQAKHPRLRSYGNLVLDLLESFK